MADNIQLSLGSQDGPIVATDDITSVHYPISKLAHGALNSATIVSSASGLPVQQQGTWNVGTVTAVTGITNTVTVNGTVTADLGATDNAVLDNIDADLTTIIGHVDGVEGLLTTIDGDTGNIVTAVQLIDDAIYVDDADWTDNTSKHVLVGGVYQSAPHTVTDGDVSPFLTDANGRLVVAATDNGGTLSIDDGGGIITVDGTVAVTNAGITTIAGAVSGTEMQVDVLTIAAGDNNIGNVDVLSVVPGTAATSLGKAEDAAHTTADTGVYVLAVRDDTLGAHSGTDGDYESFHTNASGALWVAGNGTFTVDGSGVTQPVSHAALTELAAAIDTELQVDVVGALPAGTNAIGKLAANSGVDIGDVDVTTVVPGTGATNLGKAEDGGHSSGDVGVMALGVRTDTPNAARADTDLDYAPIAVYRTGAVRTAIPEEDFAALGSNHVKKYYANTGAVTDGIVWSPAAGKRWYVTDLLLTTSAAATVTFEDDLGAGDSIVAAFDLAANSGVAHHFATPLFSGEDAADLLVTTTAGNIKITITGYEI